MKIEIEKVDFDGGTGLCLSLGEHDPLYIYLNNVDATELLYLLDEVLSNGKNGPSYPSYGNHNAE